MFLNILECSETRYRRLQKVFQKVLECSRNLMEREIVDAMFEKFRSSKVYKAKFDVRVRQNVFHNNQNNSFISVTLNSTRAKTGNVANKK